MDITAKRRLLLCFTLLFVLFTLHAAAGRVFAAPVEFKYDYGRTARLGVWGIPTELETPISSTPARDLRLEIYPESARDEDGGFTGSPIASQDVRSSAGLTGISNKATSLTFDCEPGVYYFNLYYKPTSDDDYSATATGPFTVSDAQTEDAQKVYLSSFTLAAFPQLRDPEKPGYVIEAWDYMGNLMTPTKITVASADYPAGGDVGHQYTAAVSAESPGPYRYVVTPLDDDFGVVEGSISCKPEQLTDAILRTAFFGYNTYIPIGNTITVTYRVTKGAGLRAHVKTGLHFTPFTVYDVQRTGEDGGYDVYSGNVPYGSFYDFGGKGTRFLRQVGYLDVSRRISKITVTLNAEDMNRDYRDPYEEHPNFYDDVYFNVNNAQHLVLPVGESRRVMPIRVWQAMQGDVANYFFEPDYKVDVLGDVGAINAQWDGSIGCEYETVNAVSPGVAVLRFTYDPLTLYGAPQQPYTAKDENGETIKNDDGSDKTFYSIYVSEDVTIDRTVRYAYFNSIDPRDTGIVVVHVPSAAELAASEDVRLDTGITLFECDTNYFDNGASDHAEYTFKPSAEAGAEIKVRAHKPIHIKNDGTQIAWGYGWSAADYSDGVVTKNDDGSFTVKLYEGRNVIEVSAGGVKKYHVASARGLDISVKNSTSPGKSLTVGDTAEISFVGLKPPLAKLAGIYNPGSVKVTYRRSDDGGVVSGDYGQYLASRPRYNSETGEYDNLKVELTGEELTLTDGSLGGGHWGSDFGRHWALPVDEGIPPNTTAPTLESPGSIMPDITIKAAAKQPVTDNPVTDKPSVVDAGKIPNSITDKLPENVSLPPEYDAVTRGGISSGWIANTELNPANENVNGTSLTKFDDSNTLMTNPDAILEAISSGSVDGAPINVEPDMVPLPVIRAKVESAEDVGVVPFSVMFEQFVGLRAGDIELLKMKRNGTIEAVARAASVSELAHARFLLTDEQGTPVPAGNVIEKGVNYIVTIGIRDNSDYDWDNTQGVIVDPMALAASKDNYDGSNGGCDAGTGGCAIMGLLFILALVAAFRRRAA